MLRERPVLLACLGHRKHVGSKANTLNIYILLIKCVFYREIESVYCVQRVP